MPFLLLLVLMVQVSTQTDPLVARSQRAKQALLDGRSVEAVKLYGELVKDLPNELGMRINLALALESAGKYSEEIVQLRKVLGKKPDLPAALLLLGLAEQKLGHPLEAIGPLRKALLLEPENQTVRLELADAYLATSQFAAAVEEFEKAPQSAKGWQGIGLSYAGLARSSFTQLEATSPRSATWTVLAARSQLDQQHYARAFALFREALEKQPDLPGIHGGLAEIYEKTGHPDWAAAETLAGRGSAASQLCTDSPKPTDLFCMTLRYQARAHDAFAHLTRMPESAEIHELLAEVNQRQDHRAEAIGEWRLALAFDPRSERLATKLAESLWLNRSYAEALQILEALVSANANAGVPQYLIGDILFRQQQPEAALPHLQAAVRLKPDLLEAHAVLGRVYLQLGQARKAIAHLEKSKLVDEEAISFQLGLAYKAIGNTKLAEQAFARQRELMQKQTNEPQHEPEITGPKP